MRQKVLIAARTHSIVTMTAGPLAAVLAHCVIGKTTAAEMM
jgi:hypothetical protein